MTTKVILDFDFAKQMAERYRRGFDLRQLREATLDRPRAGVFGTEVLFDVSMDWATATVTPGSFAKHEPPPPVVIHVDFERRKVWSDFCNGSIEW